MKKNKVVFLFCVLCTGITNLSTAELEQKEEKNVLSLVSECQVKHDNCTSAIKMLGKNNPRIQNMQINLVFSKDYPDIARVICFPRNKRREIVVNAKFVRNVSPEVFSAILAHELGHIALKHHHLYRFKRIFGKVILVSTFGLVNYHTDNFQERKANAYAATLLYSRGINPLYLVWLFEDFLRHDLNPIIPYHPNFRKYLDRMERRIILKYKLDHRH